MPTLKGFRAILENIRLQLDALEEDHDQSISFLSAQIEKERGILQKIAAKKVDNDCVEDESQDRSPSTCTNKQDPQTRRNMKTFLEDVKPHKESHRSASDFPSNSQGDPSDSNHESRSVRQHSRTSNDSGTDDSCYVGRGHSQLRLAPMTDGEEAPSPNSHGRRPSLTSEMSQMSACSKLDRGVMPRRLNSSAQMLTPASSVAKTAISCTSHGAEVLLRSNATNSDADVQSDAEIFELKPEWTKVPAASDIFLDQVDQMIVEKAAEEMLRVSKSKTRSGPTDYNHLIKKLGDPLHGCVPRHYIIHPSSPARLAWDMAGVCLISYDMVMIPIQLSFEPDPVWLTSFMGWATLAFWTLDMYASMVTGFYRNGILVDTPRDIIKNYLKGWFLIDIVVVLPDWIMKVFIGSATSAAGLGRILRIARIFRVLRLLRLLKLKRLFDIVYDLMDSEVSFILFNLVKLLVLIIFMNHIVACAWYFVGKLTKDGGADKNWLEDVGMTPVIDGSLAWKYLTSLHWSITQFTPASMDIWATNVGERLFSVVILFWALVMLSSIIGSITASMTALRNISSDENKQFWILRRYLKQHQIPRELTERIIKYIEFQHISKHNQVPVSGVKFLSELSEQLNTELVHAMRSVWLMDHPFFMYMADDETMKTSMQRLCYEAVKPLPCASEEILFNLGDEGTKMYFVKAGEYGYRITETQPKSTPLGPRLWASEAILWTRWRHRGTLRATMNSEALAVLPEKFSTVLHLHPKPWYFAMNYAVDFVNFLNSADHSALSDVMFDVDVWTVVVKDSDTYAIHRKRHEDNLNLALDGGPSGDQSLELSQKIRGIVCESLEGTTGSESAEVEKAIEYL